MCACSVTQWASPWTAACQGPLSTGFSRQEYWSWLPFPSAGHLPDPRIEPESLVSPVLAGRFFTTEPPEKPFDTQYCILWEKTMAPHSSTVAQKIPWMEEPGMLQSMGSLRVGHDWATSLSLSTFIHWRRKWQPLQFSYLENPMDREAWWAAVHGVGRTESDTTEAT